MLSPSSGHRRLAGGIVTLIAALAVASPAIASPPPTPELDASSLNYSYTGGVAGVDVDSIAFHFVRKAG